MATGFLSNWNVLDVNGVSFIIEQGGRFIVPFFFLSVGYYYGKTLQRGADPFTFLILYGRKLLYIFFAWSLIYAFLSPNFISEFKQFGILNSIYVQLKNTYHLAMNNKLDFIIDGTKIHLWFIVACLVGITLTSIFCKYNIERFLIPFGVALYLIGLLGGSYSKSPIGLSFPFNPPNPLFSTVFIAVGRWLSIHHEKNKRLALSLFFGGALMHFAEIYYFKEMYDIDALEHDFLLGTIIWGIGAFLLCLEYPNAGRNSIFEKVGKLTLGIYVSHYLIIYVLMPFNALGASLVWVILKPVLVLLLSYGFCQGLLRYRIVAKYLT
jgi:surface polysaccharide O-acyltransferase-like enzyme